MAVGNAVLDVMLEPGFLPGVLKKGERLARGVAQLVDKHQGVFADFRGNRQYITQGNLAENDRAFLFLMDYARRRRIKIWGRARVVEDLFGTGCAKLRNVTGIL